MITTASDLLMLFDAFKEKFSNGFNESWKKIIQKMVDEI